MGYALVVLIIVLTALAFYISKRWTGTGRYEMLGRGHVGSREIQASRWMCTIIYCFVGVIITHGTVCHILVSS